MIGGSVNVSNSHQTAEPAWNLTSNAGENQFWAYLASNLTHGVANIHPTPVQVSLQGAILRADGDLCLRYSGAQTQKRKE